MTKKMRSMVIAGFALGAMAIAGAMVLGVDDFLKLFSGVSEIVESVE
jgi:ABC-type uncharacterized transport system permease subunit